MGLFPQLRQDLCDNIEVGNNAHTRRDKQKMSKDTKINLVLGFWLIVFIYITRAVYVANLGWGERDALVISGFPAIPTIALAIALSVRLTK
jgi:hypothetical protein